MKLLYVVARAEYFLSHRLPLCRDAQAAGFSVAVATTQFCENDSRKIVGIEHFFTRFKRGSLSPLTEFKTIIDLIKAFRTFRPNLVHNVALKPTLYGAALARLYGIPSVNAINGFGYAFTSQQFKARVLRPFIKLALKLILNHQKVGVIVQNQQDYRDCKILLPKCNLFLVLGSGIDTKIFYPVAKQGVFTFTLLARMLKSKGVGEFVEAAKNFVRRHPQKKVRFLLVGSPDPENPESIPLSVLAKWRREGSIEWLGHVDDVQNIYAQTNIAVLPSYREGLPKSLLEAMACGLPIITTDTIGCNDMVHEGNGIKVRVKNVEDLEKAFEKCFADQYACEEMGQRGREEAEKMYSIDIINQEIIDIYNKIL